MICVLFLLDEIYFGINFVTTETVIGCIEGAFFWNSSIARPALSVQRNSSLQLCYKFHDQNIEKLLFEQKNL